MSKLSQGYVDDKFNTAEEVPLQEPARVPQAQYQPMIILCLEPQLSQGRFMY